VNTGDEVKVNHPEHGEMDALVIRVNKSTVEVMTLAGPVIVEKERITQ